MRHSKSSLFLMELIIAILFFSLSSTVCIQLFAKAHIVSRDTVDQNNAITQAQNLAESWLALDGDLSKMQSLFRESILSDDETLLCLLFDEDWNPQAVEISGVPAYIAELKNNGEDEKGLILASVQVFRVSETDITETRDLIYSLELSHHIQRKEGQP